MKTKTASAFLSFVITLVGMVDPAVSQSYPNKPIRMVVGYPAGGGTDVTARLISRKLEEALGQPIVIENRSGAGGIIATDFVARSAPDGYTLIMGGANAMTVNPVVHSKLPYDSIKDFVPISNIVQLPLVIAVHQSLKVYSVQDLIAYIKSRPGKVDFSSATEMSALAGEMLAQMTGTKLTRIPYRGAGPAVNAVVIGDVPMTIGESGAMRPAVAAGQIRAVAVTTAVRARALPDLPTVAEAGVPNYDIGTWYGLFAPAGTPSAIVNRLNAEVVRIVALPEIQEKLVSMVGGDPIAGSSAEFADRIRADIARYAPIAKTANIKVD